MYPNKYGNLTRDKIGDEARDKAYKIPNNTKQDTYTS